MRYEQYKAKSFNIAFGGIFSSLCLVCMLLSGVLSSASYCFVTLASFCIAVIKEELSGKYALAAYFCVSVLSALFVTDKEAASLFIAFFGFIENEEEWTEDIAHYVDDHLDNFAKIED